MDILDLLNRDLGTSGLLRRLGGLYKLPPGMSQTANMDDIIIAIECCFICLLAVGLEISRVSLQEGLGVLRASGFMVFVDNKWRFRRTSPSQPHIGFGGVGMVLSTQNMDCRFIHLDNRPLFNFLFKDVHQEIKDVMNLIRLIRHILTADMGTDGFETFLCDVGQPFFLFPHIGYAGTNIDLDAQKIRDHINTPLRSATGRRSVSEL
jgi:hypothetical protein